MHTYKSRFLVRGEVWFDREPDHTLVDWIFYRQRSRPVPGARWKYFYTILVDLTLGSQSLQHQLSDSTAYNIRRARERDKVTCEYANPVSREMLDDFEEPYNRFAAIKGLPPLDRPILDRLAKDGFLELSFAKSPDGTPLAYHAYYHDPDRSCLLHTFSLYRTVSDSTVRNALARANRYLFWSDILRHQEQGLKVFDFGGWYPGTTDHDLLEINRFKEGFGGKVVREYNCEQILSVKGWVVLTAAAWLNRARGLRAKLRPDQCPNRPAPAVADAGPAPPGLPVETGIPAFRAPEPAK